MHHIGLIVAIGFGGMFGSILRYLLSSSFQKFFRFFSAKYLPALGQLPIAHVIGTMAVNLIGCFCLGILLHLHEAKNYFSHQYFFGFVFIGITGGFTTFSAFSYETMSLYKSGHFNLAWLNVALQLIGGLLFLFLGKLAGIALLR